MSRCTPSRETSGPPRPPCAGNLIDLVDEDDAVFGRAPERLSLDRIHVDQFVPASSCAKMRRASATVTCFFVRRLGNNAAEHLADVGAASLIGCRRSCRSADWPTLRPRFRPGARRKSRVRSPIASVRACVAFRTTGSRAAAGGALLLRGVEIVAENRTERRRERIALRTRGGGRVSGCSTSIIRSTLHARRAFAHFVTTFFGDGPNRRFH